MTRHFLAANPEPIFKTPFSLPPLPEMQLALALRYVDHILKYERMGKKTRWFIPPKVQTNIKKHHLLEWRKRNPGY